MKKLDIVFPKENGKYMRLDFEILILVSLFFRKQREIDRIPKWNLEKKEEKDGRREVEQEGRGGAICFFFFLDFFDFF